MDIHELIDCLDVMAGNDKMYGGSGDDLLVGDNQSVLAAFIGAYASPIAAGIQVTGDRLVNGFDVRVEANTMRGGDGNDTLVGDSDTTVALLAGSAQGPAGSFGMTRLAERLTVAGGNGDDMKGEAGTNVVEQGNRAIAPKTLVKTVSISVLSKTSLPATPPVINWNGGVCDDVTANGTQAAWMEDFGQRPRPVRGRAQPEQQDPHPAVGRFQRYRRGLEPGRGKKGRGMPPHPHPLPLPGEREVVQAVALKPCICGVLAGTLGFHPSPLPPSPFPLPPFPLPPFPLPSSRHWHYSSPFTLHPVAYSHTLSHGSQCPEPSPFRQRLKKATS